MVMPFHVVMWKPFSKKSTGHGSLRNMVLFLRMFGTPALFLRIPKLALKFFQGMCFYPRKIVGINACRDKTVPPMTEHYVLPILA